MSDWDFLYDMQAKGCSPDQIADAAACGFDHTDQSEWANLEKLVAEKGGWDFDKQEKSPINIQLLQLLEDLVKTSRNYFEVTGRHLPIFGELGELYGELHYGIKRHKPFTQGSDGKLGNELVEIKTISPIKSNDTVQVKRAGNFSKLLIVKISEDFEFKGKMIDRKDLTKGQGKHIKARWSE